MGSEDDVIAAGEHIPGMAMLWEVVTAEERREMVLLLLEPGGLYYDLELKEIAAFKPRPAFLPLMRVMENTKKPLGRLSRLSGNGGTDGHRTFGRHWPSFLKICSFLVR